MRPAFHLVSLSLTAFTAATFSYGTVASQDPLPPCNATVLCNGPLFCADVCVDGSVVLDTWLAASVRFQYDLTQHRSWKYGPILGTHNAFISRANGFGLTEDVASALYARTLTLAATHVRVPNQRFGPSDLLNMGVRELEFDIWDLPGDSELDFDVYMCHSPVPDPGAVVAIQAAATALGLGELDYNPFAELCSNRTLKWAMGVVAAWTAAPGNEKDVVALFLDNRVATWNADNVTSAITSVWGTQLMTPHDVQSLFNGTFPSRAAMVAAGKRAYCGEMGWL